MPKVSVIIPSYNHEKYVGETLQSVLDQTYQDFEIVITDDGSTDRTVDEVRKFNDPRIRLFAFDRNTGGPLATTKCVSESTGEYLAMLSSDDMFLPDKLKKQVEFLDNHPDVAAIFGYARIIDENGNDFSDENHFYSNIFNQPNRTRHEWLNHFFYKGNCLCHPSILARRIVYTEIGPPDPRYVQLGDFYRWVRTCLKYNIYVMPEQLIKFRVRAGEANASGSRPEVFKRAYFEFGKIFRHYLEIASPEELLKAFPEASKYGEIEKDTIPYFIARLAIDNGKVIPIHQVFGINVLFDILGNKEIAQKLEKNLGFRYRDFIELTGKLDLYGMDARQALAEKDRALAEQCAEQNRQIAEKDRALAEKGRQLVDHEAQLQAMHNSLSWKMTAPLRAVMGFFK